MRNLDFYKAKMLSASGGFAPDPLNFGSAPEARWGSAQDPLYRLTLRACHEPHYDEEVYAYGWEGVKFSWSRPQLRRMRDEWNC